MPHPASLAGGPVSDRHPRSRLASRPRAARLAVVALLTALVTALAAPGISAQAAPAPTPTPAGFSAAQLATAGDRLLAADVAGTAWGVDHEARTVRVWADETVTASDLARLTRHVGPLADALTVERVPGVLRPHSAVRPGDPIVSGSGARCSAALNVRAGSTYYILTAGHCTDGNPVWYGDIGRTELIGDTAGSSFPSNDYGLIRYADPDLPLPNSPCNDNFARITSVGSPTVGQTVRFAGATSGCVLVGSVLGLNTTVNYGGGQIVSGLIRTNLCAQPGDSGGLLFSGSVGIGILSGGSGTCATGGTTFFQPIVEPMSAYGLTVA
ncbi:S1 family peptidase [Streptomyces sp. 4N509B]|uniref:S1 family peptidase n=1 Tax=Streptomyces sp. 4N509B TaxID=3457413 RepID=UPI003FD0FBA6